MNKVVFFTISLRGGGAERVISNLSNYLIEDNQVYIVLIDKDVVFELDPRIKVIKLAPFGDVKNGLFKLFLIPYYSFYLFKFIKKERINKLYSFLLRPNIIAILSNLLFRKVKVVISERSNPVAQYETNSLNDQINRYLIRKLYPKAAMITVNSYGSSVALKEFYNITKNIEIIKNPINEKFFSSHDFNIKQQDPFIFITVGRLDEGKNHIVILQAINILVKKGITNFRLHIVGSGYLMNFLTQYVNENLLNKYVCFLGLRSDVDVLMKESNCFVFASKREGFPNVIQEALASGLPIISSDCPFGPREILTGKNVLPNAEMNSLEIFENGVLVPINDIEETAKAMEYVIHNIDVFSRDNTSILEAFSMQNIVSQFKKIM